MLKLMARVLIGLIAGAVVGAFAGLFIAGLFTHLMSSRDEMLGQVIPYEPVALPVILLSCMVGAAYAAHNAASGWNRTEPPLAVVALGLSGLAWILYTYLPSAPVYGVDRTLWYVVFALLLIASFYAATESVARALKSVLDRGLIVYRRHRR